jgi:cellulose synthase/poly-beta-1,6-N-acetylglucosamine synthase-like glycosyltransferase
MTVIAHALEMLLQLLLSPFNHGVWLFIFKFIPYVLFFELPVYVLIFLGMMRYVTRQSLEPPGAPPYHPSVTCIITAYSEGESVERTIRSLAEQIYPGLIEILCLVDGAARNRETYEAARRMEDYVRRLPGRSLKVVPKWQRGGRVSSLNSGLSLSTGTVVMAVDGDTSFDNTMVRQAARHFQDPNVVGVSGCLRVRNAAASLWSRFQAIEYALSIHATRVGLSEFNIVNNISGAFGIFRRSFIQVLGGWDSGTAEDLDMTLRIKNYFGRHPHLRIRFEPLAIGHTDVPDTLRSFLRQRLRWDGDLFYIYVRKHPFSFRPAIFGWRNLIMLLWTGFFFQLVMPFVIMIYTVWVFCFYPIAYMLAVTALVYLFYLLITLLFFIVFIAFFSERPRQDIRLVPLLPLMPFFTFFNRIWAGLATLWEIIMKSHLDSAMAPWYVLKKTKF